MLNMNKVIQHFWNEIRAENSQTLTPVFDKECPIRSTGKIKTWWTSKPCVSFNKTHTNFVVFDSNYEYLEAKTLDECALIESFVKNGDFLIIETKGQDNEQQRNKRAFLDQWCSAINAHGGFGTWKWAVSFHP